MIPNQWYVVLESDEVRKGRPVGVTRMGEKLVAWRDSHGTVSIMSDKCPHRGAQLSAGALAGDCIQCPFHGFQFDTSGACKLIPANGRDAQPPRSMMVHTYLTQEAHGFIYIWWGEPRDSYPELPFFESIGETMVYGSLRDHWATHYSRAIENQLDVVHIPFVHSNTIGRGNKTLVNGPLTKAGVCYPGDNLIEIWVSNQVDQGQQPLKATQLADPDRHPSLQFRFPNIWHNWISDDLRVMVAFAPIDDANTCMYLRYYHRIRTPILRQIVSFVGNLSNLYIERQDRRIVVTQQPKRSDLNIGEVLIPGDGPIITYRKIRRTLIAQAQDELAVPQHDPFATAVV